MPRNGLHCIDPPALAAQLRAWYALPLGTALSLAEQQVLERWVPNLFGYHLVQVGPSETAAFADSRVQHVTVMDLGYDPEARAPTGFSGDPVQLPLAADSLDALILYHALEFSADPRQVLREADRVLVSDGHLVVVGFNPYSLWGARRLLSGRKGHMPWCGRFLSLVRVKDWLSLLGFETLAVEHVFFRPPMQRAGFMRRLGSLERLGARWWPVLGAVYMIHARQKRVTLTPLRPRWRPRRSLVSGLADTASRSGMGG